MSDLKLNANNDLVLENGDLVLTSGIDSVAQYLRCRLRTFLGEWFLDQSIGIPYFTEIFKKNFNPTSVDAIFKDVILTTPNIIELQEFSLNINPDRTLEVSFKVLTKEGNLAFSEVLP